MGIAPAAHHLDSSHEKTTIFLGADVLFRDRCPETGPACPRIKLGVGAEEGIATADALVNPLFFAVVILPRKSPLGPFLSANLKLLGCQLLDPLLIRLNDLIRHEKSS
jgi:hypothetical protein